MRIRAKHDQTSGHLRTPIPWYPLSSLQTRVYLPAADLFGTRGCSSRRRDGNPRRIYIYIYIYIHIHTHGYIYIYICVQTCVYIYIYIYICPRERAEAGAHLKLVYTLLDACASSLRRGPGYMLILSAPLRFQRMICEGNPGCSPFGFSLA